MEKVFEDAYNAAKERLEKLVEQRREIDKEIEKWRATVIGLSGIDDTSSFEEISENLQEPGLTDAIRLVLQNSKKPMTPPEVRDGMLLLGINLSEHRNPLASIHTVLRRLVLNDEAKKITVDNKTRFKWTGKDSFGRKVK